MISAAIAATTTSHGKMTGLVTFVAGTSVFVRLEFDTKDAMGMNMVTIASAKIADEIAQATGARRSRSRGTCALTRSRPR